MDFKFHKKGFAVLAAVVLLAAGGMAAASAVAYSAHEYAEQVWREELRVASMVSARACAHSVALMIAKDEFLKDSGSIKVEEFSCDSKIIRLASDSWSIKATSYTNDIRGDFEIIVVQDGKQLFII